MNITYTLGNIDSFVKKDLKPYINDYRLFLLKGPLGAGKTTLVKQILKQCCIVDNVTSPTFVYMNRYTNHRATFYHYDLYRLSDASAFINGGFLEYLYQNNSWHFIEWPEVIAEFIIKDDALAQQTCTISIDHDTSNNDQSRIISIITSYEKNKD